MTYLPEPYTHQTEFPAAFDKDLRMQVRMVGEKWRRYYPRIDYYCFKGDVTPTVNPVADPPSIVGEAGGSAFDPLYGETVDAAQLVTGVWQQPHGSSGVAVNPEIFETPIPVHAQIRRDAKERELKKYGFDQIRDLLVTIPTGLLDTYGITVRQGDEFVWDGDRYVVLQFDTAGYWKNTNLRLYIVINAEHKKAGS